MTPMMGRIAAPSVLRPDELTRHAGERLVFVLDRVLEMHSVDGRIARLAKRDSIYADGGLDHLYVDGSDGRPQDSLGVPGRGCGPTGAVAPFDCDHGLDAGLPTRRCGEDVGRSK